MSDLNSWKATYLLTPCKASRWALQWLWKENHPLQALVSYCTIQYVLLGQILLANLARGCLQLLKFCGFLIVVLESGNWRIILLLWVARVQGALFCLVSAAVTLFWNHLAVSILAPLILCNLLAVYCNLATWHHRLSTRTDPLHVLVFSPEEGSGHSFQPLICTEISFLTSSLWGEASDISGAFSVETLILTLRWVPIIMAET